jgi:hypothetical protein
MTDDRTMEKWRQLAVHIGDNVHSMVNLPEYVGTKDETGYVLIFFNAMDPGGKSTLVSSCIDRPRLKKLLKAALTNLNLAVDIERGRKQ